MRDFRIGITLIFTVYSATSQILHGQYGNANPGFDAIANNIYNWANVPTQTYQPNGVGNNVESSTVLNSVLSGNYIPGVPFTSNGNHQYGNTGLGTYFNGHAINQQAAIPPSTVSYGNFETYGTVTRPENTSPELLTQQIPTSKNLPMQLQALLLAKLASVVNNNSNQVYKYESQTSLPKQQEATVPTVNTLPPTLNIETGFPPPEIVKQAYPTAHGRYHLAKEKTIWQSTMTKTPNNSVSIDQAIIDQMNSTEQYSNGKSVKYPSAYRDGNNDSFASENKSLQQSASNYQTNQASNDFAVPIVQDTSSEYRSNIGSTRNVSYTEPASVPLSSSSLNDLRNIFEQPAGKQPTILNTQLLEYLSGLASSKTQAYDRLASNQNTLGNTKPVEGMQQQYSAASSLSESVPLAPWSLLSSSSKSTVDNKTSDVFRKDWNSPHKNTSKPYRVPPKANRPISTTINDLQQSEKFHISPQAYQSMLTVRIPSKLRSKTLIPKVKASVSTIEVFPSEMQAERIINAVLNKSQFEAGNQQQKKFKPIDSQISTSAQESVKTFSNASSVGIAKRHRYLSLLRTRVDTELNSLSEAITGTQPIANENTQQKYPSTARSSTVNESQFINMTASLPSSKTPLRNYGWLLTDINNVVQNVSANKSMQSQGKPVKITPEIYPGFGGINPFSTFKNVPTFKNVEERDYTADQPNALGTSSQIVQSVNENNQHEHHRAGNTKTKHNNYIAASMTNSISTATLNIQKTLPKIRDVESKLLQIVASTGGLTNHQTMAHGNVNGNAQTSPTYPSTLAPVIQKIHSTDLTKGNVQPYDKENQNQRLAHMMATLTASFPQRAASSPGGKCNLSPICGQDDVTYFSDCLLPTSVSKKCDGYCPCAQLKQPSDQGPQQTTPSNVNNQVFHRVPEHIPNNKEIVQRVPRVMDTYDRGTPQDTTANGHIASQNLNTPNTAEVKANEHTTPPSILRQQLLDMIKNMLAHDVAHSEQIQPTSVKFEKQTSAHGLETNTRAPNQREYTNGHMHDTNTQFAYQNEHANNHNTPTGTHTNTQVNLPDVNLNSYKSFDTHGHVSSGGVDSNMHMAPQYDLINLGPNYHVHPQYIHRNGHGIDTHSHSNAGSPPDAISIGPDHHVHIQDIHTKGHVTPLDVNSNSLMTSQWDVLNVGSNNHIHPQDTHAIGHVTPSGVISNRHEASQWDATRVGANNNVPSQDTHANGHVAHSDVHSNSHMVSQNLETNGYMANTGINYNYNVASQGLDTYGHVPYQGVDTNTYPLHQSIGHSASPQSLESILHSFSNVVNSFEAQQHHGRDTGVHHATPATELQGHHVAHHSDISGNHFHADTLLNPSSGHQATHDVNMNVNPLHQGGALSGYEMTNLLSSIGSTLFQNWIEQRNQTYPALDTIGNQMVSGHAVFQTANTNRSRASSNKTGGVVAQVHSQITLLSICLNNCMASSDPVCSEGGNTYDNECYLLCSGELKMCNSTCPCDVELLTVHQRQALKTMYSAQALTQGMDPLEMAEVSWFNKRCACAISDTSFSCSSTGQTNTQCYAQCNSQPIRCRGKCPCR